MKELEFVIWAEQYEDINFIILFVGVFVGGFQLFSKDEEWLFIMLEENEIVINVGDMLQWLINNYLKFIIYWVVNFLWEEWYLFWFFILFFFYLKLEMDLSVLLKCIIVDNLLYYEFIMAGEYFDECLCEIGLKK